MLKRLNNDEFCFVLDTEIFHCEFSLKAPLNSEKAVKSDKFFMNNFRWFICAKISAVDNLGDCLGIFLYRAEKTESSNVKIKFSMRVVSNDNKIDNVSRGPAINSFPWNDSYGFGWNPFVKVSDLTDVRKGYLTNGNITVKFDATFVK